MWYDDPFVKFKKRKKNRRRRGGSRAPILMVNARVEEKRRDRLNRLGVLVLCLAAVGGTLWVTYQGGRLLGRALFSENVRYAVKHFDISSDGNRIPPAFIRETFGLSDNVNLFSVNIGFLRSEIESVPLVRKARIQRILPDTLKISVVERVAIARLGNADTPYPLAIDRHGYVLGRSARAPGLPMIIGAENSEHRPGQPTPDEGVQLAIRVLDLCDTNKRLSRVLDIRAVDIRSANQLVLVLDKGRQGRLPREDVEDRLYELAAGVQESEANGLDMKEFNFTVSKNPAIR